MAPPGRGSKKKGSGPVSWNPKLEPLMKHLFGSDGVKTRQAAEEGRRAVEYFRGKDFVKWALTCRHTLESQFPHIKELFDTEDQNTAIESIGNNLLHAGFFYRAIPLSAFGESTATAPQSTATTGKGSPGGADRDKPPKWPKKLQLSRNQSFEENAFYVVCYEGSKFGNHAMLAMIIASVLVICMFPAWPLPLKLGVWYVSVVLLTIILGLVVLRLILFVFLWYFGVDFWLLPNLFNEDVGVIDSFIPGYTFDYRKDTWLMVFARLFCLIITIAGIYQLGQTHSISDVHQFATRQFLDVLDWGHQKLSPPPEVKPFQSGIDPLTRPKASASSFSAKSKKGNGDDFVDDSGSTAVEEEDEDYSCLRKCGFASFEELMDECLTDCPCMQELVTSPCYKACPDNVKHSLSEARLDACVEDTGGPDGEKNDEL